MLKLKPQRVLYRVCRFFRILGILSSWTLTVRFGVWGLGVRAWALWLHSSSDSRQGRIHKETPEAHGIQEAKLLLFLGSQVKRLGRSMGCVNMERFRAVSGRQHVGSHEK